MSASSLQGTPLCEGPSGLYHTNIIGQCFCSNTYDPNFGPNVFFLGVRNFNRPTAQVGCVDTTRCSNWRVAPLGSTHLANAQTGNSIVARQNHSVIQGPQAQVSALALKNATVLSGGNVAVQAANFVGLGRSCCQ